MTKLVCQSFGGKVISFITIKVRMMNYRNKYGVLVINKGDVRLQT